ncbi:hypothetical protein EYV94_17750 [Puteibacter caeruleilacunae]|nr:hypothetical protein EYV94_17750 [Puteibacter caeruleilacunae]
MNKMYFPLFIMAYMVMTTLLQAQEPVKVSGDIVDDNNEQAIAFANVALLSYPDSVLVEGTISNMDGAFSMNANPNHEYLLRISYLGYKTHFQSISPIEHSPLKLSKIKLKSSVINLQEATVIADRQKAKSSVDKTSYFISKSIVSSSSDGIDVLKNIPGVQLDLQRNISLEGSRNIKLLVNGVERNKEFVSQLNPNMIDHVDIVSMPGSRYDADITGVINIVLKKNHENGISGQVHLEIPTTSKLIFIFPNYSLNITRNKWNIYTSYNGELSYFDIKEITEQQLKSDHGNETIHSTNYIRQKKWSHVFHYGADFIANDHHQFSLYGMINPYSYEHDGSVNYEAELSQRKEQWRAMKDDDDNNLLAYHSLYYKYSRTNSSIDCDINLNTLDGRSITHLNSIEDDNKTSTNSFSYPRERLMSVQLNYTQKVGERWNLGVGVKSSYQHMWDGRIEDFDYKNQVNASYISFNYSSEHFQARAGVRVEHADSEFSSLMNHTNLSWLPSFDIQKSIGKSSKLKLNYRRWLWRPGIHQKNPAIRINSPYFQESGNPNLAPYFTNDAMVEYARQKVNYFAARLFYRQSTDVISNLYFVDESSVLQKTIENAGTKYQYGVQLLNSLKLTKMLSLNSFVKMYEITTSPNQSSRNYGVDRKNWFVFATSFSLTAQIKDDLVASFNLEYSSPQTEIQDNYYDEPLYFLSLDKSYKKWKFGIISALPFDKYFLYDSNDISGDSFDRTYKGYVNTMLVPIWFKVSFQFNKGKNKKVRRNHEPQISRARKGF